MEFISALSEAFRDAADYTLRPVRAAGVDCWLCFIDGLVAGAEVGELLLRPLMGRSEPMEPAALLDWALTGGAAAASAALCLDPEEAETKLLGGFCLLLVPGAGAAAFELKSGEKRGVSEPEVESTTRGPKDAFTETARTNTALLRRHLRSPRL